MILSLRSIPYFLLLITSVIAQTPLTNHEQELLALGLDPQAALAAVQMTGNATSINVNGTQIFDDSDVPCEEWEDLIQAEIQSPDFLNLIESLVGALDPTDAPALALAASRLASSAVAISSAAAASTVTPSAIVAPTTLPAVTTSAMLSSAPSTVAVISSTKPISTSTIPATTALPTTSSSILLPSSSPSATLPTTSSTPLIATTPVSSSVLRATSATPVAAISASAATPLAISLAVVIPPIPIALSPTPKTSATPIVIPTPTKPPAPVNTIVSPWSLLRSHSGSSFFDGFYFFNYPDPTSGNVDYVSQSDAQRYGLAYTTNSGSSVMRVDNSSWLDYGVHRRSVRIQSIDTFEIGSLLIMDANFLPWGPTTWPAFWSNGPNWPSGGEIDIVEGTNNDIGNHMTLHTQDGCYLATPMAAAGTASQDTNCYAYVNSNIGCGTYDPDPTSYGRGFNAAGGGLYVMQLLETGISIWRFMRNNIPADIIAEKPTPGNWGPPRAHFDQSACQIRNYFSTQTIIFDITLCGDYAGATYDSASSGISCVQAVQDPSNYQNAYFDVNYVKVFSLK